MAPEDDAGETAAAKASAVEQTLKQKAPWLRVLYKAVVIVIGAVVTIAGVVMLPLPGPGWLVIFACLGLLSTQIPAVGRFTGRLKSWVAALPGRIKARRASRPGGRPRA